MTRDEIVDFLEWAKECGQLQFPESRKVDMAEMYIKEQDAVNKTTESIICPECGYIQYAKVEHTIPFWTYIHECEKCEHIIMESEWQRVEETK